MPRSSSDRTKLPNKRRKLRVKKGSQRARHATNNENTTLRTVGSKQAAKAPCESEERFRKIFERSHDAIFVLDPFTDKIIDCNPRACELLGFSSRELLSKRVSDIHPGEMPRLLALAQRHSKKENGWTGELACLTRSGTSLLVEMSASIIHTGGKDHVLAIVRDITQRKQAEQALREIEQGFRHLVEHAADAVFLVDDKYRFAYVNQRACDWLGYTREELLTMSIPDIQVEISLERIKEVWKRMVPGVPVTFTGTHRRKDGTRFPAEIREGLIELSGRQYRFSLIRDLTERRRGEEDRQKLVALIENSPDLIGFGTMDNPPKPQYINPAGLKMLGFDTLEAAASHSMLDFHPEDEQKRFMQISIPALFEKGHWEGETHLRHWKTGKRIPVHRHLFTVNDPQTGTPIMIATIARDITALKRVQEELKEAKEGLERRVEERTAELERANARLQEQVAVHQRELAAMEASMDGIAILDADEAYVYINEAHAKIYGYANPEALLGKSWRELYFDDEIKRIEQEAQPWLREKGHWQGEIMGKRRDGGTIETEISLTTIAGGGLICICRDITERKQAEQSLRKLASIVEHTESGVVLASGDKFELVNPAFARMHDYSVEELVGAPVAQVFPPEFRAQLPERFRAVNEQGRLTFEAPHLRKDGSVFPTLIQVTRVGDKQGKPFHRIATVIDITERKKAEEALRRYTKRLETLQEIDRAILAARSPEQIAVAALHHIQDLVPCLRASFTLFDSETREVIVMATQSRGETKIGAGTRWHLTSFEHVETLRQGKSVVVDDIRDRALSPLVEALRAEGVRSSASVPLIATNEFIGTINLASEKPGAFSNEEVEIVGEIANSLAIAIQQARLHEQVQRHAAELEQRVAERTAELESFSYSVSHDLRSPLRAIDGFSRILLEDHAGKLDTECQRLLKIIRGNTQNMGRLIDDLLAFSRLGRKEIQPSDIDMGELAKIVFEELKAQTPERRLQITIKPLPGAYGDRSMLRQVFVNLISNSIKFTRDREVARIEIAAEIKDHQNVYFVKDNGVGFEMRYVHKLFGVFQRLHGAEEYEGTGVGLAIVHRIIHRHGGRVWAEGKVNEGATIYFTLPRKGVRT